MTRPTFLALIHRTVRDWLAHREARQRQERFARLCRAVPELSAASERLSHQRKQHKPTRAVERAVRDAMTKRLQGELHHG